MVPINSNMNEKDIFGVLYIIDSFGKLNFRKRLQKLVCIAKYSNEIKYPFSFEFIKFHYGPYSFELKDCINKLIIIGLVEEKEANRIGYSYTLTMKGKNFKDLIKSKIDLSLIKRLKGLYASYSEKSVSQLTLEAKKFFGW
jgi:hypothetical protein